MIQIRRSEERGHADHGWLDTYHTFSFNTYHDEKHMGFRSLRVINEDRIQPGMGFGTHPHHDMEIITYVIEGALEHKDNMGNGSVIRPGNVQRMSAGSGVMHSEFNPSNNEPVHLLQIWILPERKGVEPGYEEKNFAVDEKRDRFRLIASRDGRDQSVRIHQDANVYASVLDKETDITMPIQSGRHVWVQVISGNVQLGDYYLKAGDGASVSEEESIRLKGLEASEMLVFDLN
jgi:redox-sensitive bicupin YhaK (pirin superfamily)